MKTLAASGVAWYVVQKGILVLTGVSHDPVWDTPLSPLAHFHHTTETFVTPQDWYQANLEGLTPLILVRRTQLCPILKFLLGPQESFCVETRVQPVLRTEM